MQFNCKSQHHKCKAQCCFGIMAFPKETWEKNQHKIITKPSVVETDTIEVKHRTDSGACSFLREDYQCNIYEERPEVCRKYGDESTFYMSCQFLRKDGKQRTQKGGKYLKKMVEKQYDDPNSFFNLQNRFNLFPDLYK
jgi:Fe-S-cluster containining protein